MKTSHRFAALAAAIVAATGVFTATMPTVAGAAPADFSSCDLSVKLAELQGWDPNGHWNIMVWKESAGGFTEGPNDVGVSDGTWMHECKNLSKRSNYYWKVFKTGTFVHKGDGGFRNWAYLGKFTKDGETVHFLSP